MTRPTLSWLLALLACSPFRTPALSLPTPQGPRAASPPSIVSADPRHDARRSSGQRRLGARVDAEPRRAGPARHALRALRQRGPDHSAVARHDPLGALSAAPRGARQWDLRPRARRPDVGRAARRAGVRHRRRGLGGGAGAAARTGSGLSDLRRRPRRRPLGGHALWRSARPRRPPRRRSRHLPELAAALFPLGALLRPARRVPAADPLRRRRERTASSLRRRDRLHGQRDRPAAPGASAGDSGGRRRRPRRDAR